MKRTVLLYGHLGRVFGRVHKLDVRSPAEAVRALMVNHKAFRKAVIDGGRYRVLVGGRAALDARQLPAPTSASDTIRVVPVVAGAKRGGLLTTILGIILVVVGAFTSEFGGEYLVNAGIGMIIGGVAQMLFAPPRTIQSDAESPENRPSYAFDGAVNTAAQGNAVPVLYGRLIIGSQVVSAGLTVEQLI